MVKSVIHPNRKRYNWVIYESNIKLLEELTPSIRGHLFDLGCGEMPYKEWLKKYADTYTGVDWANSMHSFHADICADLNQILPIQDGVADTVISVSVMEHLREPETFLREAHRILKPSGTIVLQVPFMWWVHEEPYDYYRFTRYGLEHILKKAGFCNINIKCQTGFWQMWVVKFNYQTARLIKGPPLVRFIVELALRPIWYINQYIAKWLDTVWKSESETAGYVAIANK
jgi:SAM-dependent methyltransferase